MTKSQPDGVAAVTETVLQDLILRYPLLGTIEDSLQLHQSFVDYFQLLASEQMLDARADQGRLQMLFELAALTQDAAAPVYLIGSFLSLCEERSGRATPALVRKRAMGDMAAITVQMVKAAIRMAEVDASFSDTSTGLPNRAGVCRSLEEMLLSRQDIDPDTAMAPDNLAILCVDVRHALEGNGRQGHPLHEAAMGEVARVLGQSVRKRDVVARTGAQQFHVLLPGLRHALQAQTAASQVHFKLNEETLDVVGRTFTASSSIGVTVFPEDGATADQLLDRAMLAADEAFRTSEPFVKFSKALEDRTDTRRAELVNQIMDAVANNEALLYFQPQLDLQTGKVTSAEALLRLQLDGKPVAPDRVLDAVHEYGTRTHKANPFPVYVIKHALQAIYTFKKRGNLDITLAVNLPANLIKADLVDHIPDMLRTWDLPAECLKIEITEKFPVADMKATRALLQKLKDFGVQLALDDFGTGHSTFSWLLDMPMDVVKVDQTFVRDLMSSPDKQVLVRSQVKLAHDLGLQVVVEGVEDAETQQFITDLGCETLQGYVFSRPLPFDDFLAFVTRHNAAAGHAAG